jgi:outer membrane protein OmpA-like peptidoglycan-associated protein
MRLSRNAFIILIIFSFHYTSAQELPSKTPVNISAHADCERALLIRPLGVFGPTEAPEGHGQILEIKGNHLGNLYYIEKEHNTVWYRFVAVENTLLTFRIVPISPADDYDFLLFKMDSNTCEQIKDGTLKALRSNIARNNKHTGGVTGLSIQAENTHVPAGPADNFSKAIYVKKGEAFLLLLDNVYPKGKGHSIEFSTKGSLTNRQPKKPDPPSTETPTSIKGRLIDEESAAAIEADVILQEIQTGKILASTKTNPLDGSYELRLERKLDNRATYLLSFEPEGAYFFREIRFNPYNHQSLLKKGFDITIPVIKKGDVYRIENILFYGDQAIVLPESEPSLKRLHKTMKKNPGLKISIEGHTNGCTKSVGFSEQLSKDRAATVSQYLVDAGIDPDRMQKKGFGCRHMIYEDTFFEPQARLNRRVEIRILDF